MENACYIHAHHMLTALGDGTAENIRLAKSGESGIREVPAGVVMPEPFYGAVFNDEIKDRLSAKSAEFTLLENGIIHCIESVLAQYPESRNTRCALVLASTKGNIDLLNTGDSTGIPASRANLAEMAKAIGRHFHFEKKPLMVSNACISGLSAMLVAKNLLDSNACDYVVVAGGDLVSQFVVSGFQSLLAVSETPCKPYDKSRSGMTPGEGCAAVVLSKHLPKGEKAKIRIAGGGQANDANHISGPSRSGEGLVCAVNKVLREADLPVEKIDFINAHGTATNFNDEMESIAFKRLNMSSIPLNSLKGYLGHTLGAAGLIETIFAMEALKSGLVLKTAGYETPGISKPLTITRDHHSLKYPEYALKTISGFGGCNAAIVLQKQ